MKLLIVEDERELSESIVCFLRHEDYLCEQAFTYDEAMLRVAVYEYDCVLLDLMLPDGTGLDVLRKVKRVAPPGGAPSFCQWPQETVVSKAAESK